MKRIVHHISSVLMLAVFLYVGTGFNVYDYCCDACRNAGSAVFTTTSCAEVHHDHDCGDKSCGHVPHGATHSDKPGINMPEPDHCEVERYTITQNFTAQTYSVAPDYTWCAVLAVSPIHKLVSALDAFVYLHRKIPPLLSTGRDVLLSSSILII